MAQCLVNDKIYVGKSVKSLSARRKGHLDDALRGSNRQLARAIRKHGRTAFEWQVLSQNLSPEEANNLERMWILLLQSNDRRFGYNSTAGGDQSGRRWTEAEKLKVSASTKGKPNAGAFVPGSVPWNKGSIGVMPVPFNKGMKGWKHRGSFPVGWNSWDYRKRKCE